MSFLCCLAFAFSVLAQSLPVAWGNQSNFDLCPTGAKSPSNGDPQVELSIANEPYGTSSATMSAFYYGFDENSVSVSFVTHDINILNYSLSSDALIFTVSPCSDICSLEITFSDDETSISRDVTGYSTQYGVFYEDSLNHAQRKYMAYLWENNIIDDEQFDAYNAYACSASYQYSGDPTISYSPLQSSNLGAKGRLTWKDDWDKRTFPLKGIRVEIGHYHLDAGMLTYSRFVADEVTYTDINGRYHFSASLEDIQQYYIRVCAQTEYAQIRFSPYHSLSSIECYRKLFWLNRDVGEEETEYCFEQDDDISKAMQITQATYYGGKYAKEMLGHNPQQVNVYFPSVLVDIFGGKTQSAANVLVLPGLFLGSSIYKMWDVILHEYGHWMQACYGYFPEIVADHFIDSYTALCKIYSPHLRTELELPWQEAWPSVFALRVTKHFSGEIGPLRFVNDNGYNGLDRKSLAVFHSDYETPPDYCLRYGDCGELTIGALLYDMYDSYAEQGNYESHDLVSYSDSFIWNMVMDPLVKNFDDFYHKVYESPHVNKDSFGRLLSHHGMTVDSVTKVDGLTPTTSPTFYLDKCNSSGEEEDPYASNVFHIDVYDSDLSSGSLLFSKVIENSQSFSFSFNEWDTIMHSYGLSYAFRIYSDRTNSLLPSGHYRSRVFVFHKPTNNTYSYDTFSDSTRLLQQTINLYPSSNYQKMVTFAVSGYKVFQTLGDLDTKIYLYNPSGSLLMEDDDSGYGNNALVGMYCSANVQYKIKVTTYDSWNSGRSRLIVTSSPGYRFDYSGNIECYDDIVNLSGGSWTYGCWALQYESLMITYTPGQSGYHTISLTSVFDNYLYVIDPRSSQSMYNSGVNEYDDDSGPGYNARLRKYLDQGVPYLIVFCQQNPANSFTNLNEGDDLEIKIEVG